MTKYKFDGKNLKISCRTLANFYGNKISKGSGSIIVTNINGGTYAID